MWCGAHARPPRSCINCDDPPTVRRVGRATVGVLEEITLTCLAARVIGIDCAMALEWPSRRCTPVCDAALPSSTTMPTAADTGERTRPPTPTVDVVWMDRRSSAVIRTGSARWSCRRSARTNMALTPRLRVCRRTNERHDMASTTGYVPGGFDMLHIGHLNILRAARERCDHLVVGVATDESLAAMKGRAPVIPQEERMEIIAQLRFVDEVVEDISQDKRVAWRARPFDVLFKGTDWQGTPKGARLEADLAEVGARLVYLPYTPSTSSTLLREFLVASVR